LGVVGAGERSAVAADLEHPRFLIAVGGGHMQPNGLHLHRLKVMAVEALAVAADAGDLDLRSVVRIDGQSHKISPGAVFR
jgi:hypothetical protein